MTRKYNEPCEHISNMWKLCKENGVDFFGCDCSGFVQCKKCNVEISNEGGQND